MLLYQIDRTAPTGVENRYLASEGVSYGLTGDSKLCGPLCGVGADVENATDEDDDGETAADETDHQYPADEDAAGPRAGRLRQP